MNKENQTERKEPANDAARALISALVSGQDLDDTIRRELVNCLNTASASPIKPAIDLSAALKRALETPASPELMRQRLRSFINSGEGRPNQATHYAGIRYSSDSDAKTLCEIIAQDLPGMSLDEANRSLQFLNDFSLDVGGGYDGLLKQQPWLPPLRLAVCQFLATCSPSLDEDSLDTFQQIYMRTNGSRNVQLAEMVLSQDVSVRDRAIRAIKNECLDFHPRPEVEVETYWDDDSFNLG